MGWCIKLLSNILQQLTKNDKKDPDLAKYEKLRNEIGQKLKQTEIDESALKFQVIKLAESLEKIMIKYNQEIFVNQIFTLLSRYFKSEWDISEKTEQLLQSFFEDYPKYTRNIVRNNSPYILSETDQKNSFDMQESIKNDGSLPQENKLYRSNIENAISTIDKIDFSRLTKDQCLIFNDKLNQLSKNKQHELEYDYRLFGSKTKKNHNVAVDMYNPYEEDEEPKIASPGNKIVQALIKIRNQFNEMITQSQYMKFPSPELEQELSGYFDTFYKTLRFITDKKHKASIADWNNISLATNDYNSNYASSTIKFLAPLCAKCKDKDLDLDPLGKKHIFRHVQMYAQYQANRKYDNKKQQFIGEPYIYRCPRCSGTKQKEEEMSVERINESLVYMNSLLIDIINKSDILKACSIYFEELIKPGRLETAHNTSNKLLSKK